MTLIHGNKYNFDFRIFMFYSVCNKMAPPGKVYDLQAFPIISDILIKAYDELIEGSILFTDIEKKIIEILYTEDISYSSIAKRLESTPSIINKHINTARNKIYNIFILLTQINSNDGFDIINAIIDYKSGKTEPKNERILQMLNYIPIKILSSFINLKILRLFSERKIVYMKDISKYTKLEIHTPIITSYLTKEDHDEIDKLVNFYGIKYKE